MMVKICGITNGDDAAASADAGASALGFNFYPKSPRAVTPAAARAIVENLPPDILKVGVFVNEAPAAIERTMLEAGLDVAQVIGAAPAGCRFWMVHRVTTNFSPAELDDAAAEAFLLDTPSTSVFGGTGQTFEWSRARIAGKRIVIAGGLGPDNVASAIEQSQPWGVDACSRLESAPGRKDHQKVRDFVRAALHV